MTTWHAALPATEPPAAASFFIRSSTAEPQGLGAEEEAEVESPALEPEGVTGTVMVMAARVVVRISCAHGM